MLVTEILLHDILLYYYHGENIYKPTSDFTRPGAWSKQDGDGNVWVNLHEHVRDVGTNHTYNTHLGLTVVRLGTEGPSLHSRQERTKAVLRSESDWG